MTDLFTHMLNLFVSGSILTYLIICLLNCLLDHIFDCLSLACEVTINLVHTNLGCIDKFPRFLHQLVIVNVFAG